MLLQPSHLAGDILPSLVVHSGYHLHKAKVIYDPEKPLYKKKQTNRILKLNGHQLKFVLWQEKKLATNMNFALTLSVPLNLLQSGWFYF